MRIEMKILNKEFYSNNNHSYSESDCNKLCLAGYDKIPQYTTAGSAAIDLVCTEDLTIMPGETKMIPTGLAIHIGSNKHPTSFFDYAGLILPRSGLGTKGLILANTIGLVDEDYQGQLMVSAWNRLDPEYTDIDYETMEIGNAIELKAGDRFAQLLFLPVIKASFEIVEDFSNCTKRGQNGFGSTGINND